MKNTNIGMKMRHNIKLFATCIMGAAMLLSSCEERLGGEGNIGFTADVASYKGYGVGSKAAPIGNVTSFTDKYGTDGFTVSAYNGTTARFTNANSSYNNGIWVLDQDADWFSGETLDFYAMAAPATTNGGVSNLAVNAASRQMTFDYLLPNLLPADQPDVMVGYYSGLGEEGTQAGVRVAPLTFYHPLSAIRIKAGDIAGAGWKISNFIITNVYHKGSCVVDMANLGTSTNAVTWTIDTDYRPTIPGATPPEGFNTNVVGEEFNPLATPIQGTIIGGSQESTFMVIPQTLNSELQIVFEYEKNSYHHYKVNLENLVLKPGKIYDITVNFKGIELEAFDERAMIIPWDPQPAISYNDFELVPTMAYLEAGPAFNQTISNFGTVTKIIFDREGAVDETGTQIQDPTPDGLPIYASYDNGVVRITTHANTIKAHQNMSQMFMGLENLTEIEWGQFFDTETAIDMSYMFSGCSSLTDINLIDVVSTANVTNMKYMFNGCAAATRILLGNNFITNLVTDMSYMFNGCSSITSLNLGNYFDTSNVTDMDHMFCNCTGLSALETGPWFRTRKVTNMDSMFENCSFSTLHFNAKFYISSNPRTSTDNMMRNALANRANVYVTQATWNYVSVTANTGFNGTNISVHTVPGE